MPYLPVSAAVAAAPGEASRIADRLYTLIKGPSNPVDFPLSIVSGLSSSHPSIQQTAIAEQRAYIRRLFFLEFHPYFMVSSIATAGIILLLIAIGIPVALHRLYHGRLDVFRLERRMQGSYIIPNAINCFLLLEGLYGILTVAFNFCVWELFNNHRQGWMYLFQPLRSLIWIPLYIGAFLTGWGSFYTAPGALDKPTAFRYKTSAKGHLQWPLIVNLSCLGTPVALIISLLPPVCLSSVKMTKAYNSYKEWDRSFERLLDATAAGSLVNQVALDNFRSRAYAIFKDWTMSYYYVDIGYVLWSFWALLFLFFYVPAGGVLVYLLHRQVRKQRAILLSYQRKLEIQLAQEQRGTQISVLTGEQAGMQAGQAAGHLSGAHPSSRLGAPLEDIHEDRGASDGSDRTGRSGATASFKGSQGFLGLESALRHDPSASHQVHEAMTPGITSRMGHVASLAEEVGSSNGPGTGSTPLTPATPNTPRPPSAFRKLMRLETGSSSQRGDLLSPKTKRKRISITGGPMLHYKYLRRCLVNLLIFYFGIISAATCFGAITIYLASVEYEHALQGPDAVAYPIAVAGTTAAWASAVFGALTIGSIVFRNFDNPKPETSQNSNTEGGGAGGLRRHFHRNASRRTLDSAAATSAEQNATDRNPVMQGNTRTLPAVPESIDLEASMLSVIQSKPHIAMNTGMKFNMSEQSLPGGGFVIRPDDQLASMLSTAGNTPETKDGPRVGGKQGKSLRPPSKVRAWLSREREATMSIPQDVTESFGLASVPMMVGRSNQGSEREALEDPSGHFKTTDSTLAEYPSFDPRILKGAQEASASLDTTAVRSRDTKPSRAEESPSSPVVKYQSRLSDSVGSETPASRIAREWARSQYFDAPLPETPTTTSGRGRELDSLGLRHEGEGEGAWISDLAGSPPASPPSSPPRPTRDLRRLLGEADSQRRDGGAFSPDARF
ncbi:hypothetical protein NDA13_006400 [Ustilago tritici]|nr:hypothetical protein NDA13_006400 [Ustilago tritici]